MNHCNTQRHVLEIASFQKGYVSANALLKTGADLNEQRCFLESCKQILLFLKAQVFENTVKSKQVKVVNLRYKRMTFFNLKATQRFRQNNFS